MKKLRAYFEQYERHLSAATILLAFVVDTFTFARIDLYTTQVLLIVYLVVVGAGIVLINLYEDGRVRWLSEQAYFWVFVAMQFSFGGLFGRFLIYYSRSGSLSVSWPFLLLLGVFLVSNELVKKQYTRLVVQISFFFLALFSFLIFFIPILTGTISDGIFLLSGAVSVALIAWFVHVLSRAAPMRVSGSLRGVAMGVGAIFVTMNILYFTNSIPPIPLSLRAVGVYHFVARTERGYMITREEAEPLAFLKRQEIVHLISGDPLFVYSAVFAPTDFDTSIVHEWQIYDPVKNEWVTASTVAFPIVGGQDRGYRGYSTKSNIASGLWRVNIETVRGQTIGRVLFLVEYVTEKPALYTDVL